MYGILVGQFGIPHSDQEFLGSKYVESRNIRIQNTSVRGLHAMPMEVPNIQTNDGSFVQGPARDLFRLFGFKNGVTFQNYRAFNFQLFFVATTSSISKNSRPIILKIYTVKIHIFPRDGFLVHAQQGRAYRAFYFMNKEV